jgi:hypothetical protein
MYKLEVVPVEVIAYFNKGKLSVIRFRWKDTTYKVSKVVSMFNEKNGDRHYSHYIVKCKEQKMICQLKFCHNDLRWELVQWDNIN